MRPCHLISPTTTSSLCVWNEKNSLAPLGCFLAWVSYTRVYKLMLSARSSINLQLHLNQTFHLEQPLEFH